MRIHLQNANARTLAALAYKLILPLRRGLPARLGEATRTRRAGATFSARGFMYLPNASVTINGSSASNNSHCTKIVKNTFTTNAA